ncbi:MAG: transposase [Clostridiales bacterium]|nr:transposase [Clostridiales bacterium]
MLEDVTKIRRVVLATGYVDLRKGIDGLAVFCQVEIPKIGKKIPRVPKVTHQGLNSGIFRSAIQASSN